MVDDITVLGFDFGLKYIGVAIGQTLLRQGRALTTLKAKEGEPQWQQVDKLIADWRPKALIVGIPVMIDGQEQTITHAARAFAKQLMDRFELPVYQVDERLTSKAARENLFEQGGYKALKKTAIDSEAARLIVEQWLKQHTNKD